MTICIECNPHLATQPNVTDEKCDDCLRFDREQFAAWAVANGEMTPDEAIAHIEA